jgi:hypothetical protein
MGHERGFLPNISEPSALTLNTDTKVIEILGRILLYLLYGNAEVSWCCRYFLKMSCEVHHFNFGKKMFKKQTEFFHLIAQYFMSDSGIS